MEKFESTGYWYLPDRPDHSLVGTLRSDGKVLLLTLTGGFTEFEFGDTEIDKYDIIYGVVDDNPAGKHVTLLNSLSLSKTIRIPGANSQVIRPETALVGQSLLDRDELHFTGCEMQFTHLDSWCDFVNFTQSIINDDKEAKKYTVTYHEPLPRPFRMDDREFHFDARLSFHQDRRRVEMCTNPVIISEMSSPLDLDEIAKTIVRPLQELLSFATNAPNANTFLSVWSGDSTIGDRRQRFGVFRAQLFDPVESSDLAPDQMLFSYPEAQESDVDVFGAWYTFRTKFHGFCNVYFAHQATPDGFAESCFIRVLHELQLFFRFVGRIESFSHDVRDQMGQILHQPLSPDHRQWMAALLPDAIDLSFPFNLQRSLEENEDIVAPLMEEESREFVDRVLTTLVQVYRREDGARLRSADEVKCLYYLIARLSVLLRVCVLRELGFSQDWISAVISDNQTVMELKLLSRRPGFGLSDQ